MSHIFLGIKSRLSYGLEIGAATWRWLCFIRPLPSLVAQKKKTEKKRSEVEQAKKQRRWTSW